MPLTEGRRLLAIVCRNPENGAVKTRLIPALGVEGTRALETTASADLDYITSLLAYNLAKLSVARALGNAEDNLGKYLTVQ